MLIFNACANKPVYTQEQLYEMVSSGVVLVKVEYVQTITLSNDGKNVRTFDYVVDTNGIRFQGIKSDIESIYPAFNISEDFINTSFGTGFLISKKGLVVTNSHVISPKDDNSEVVFNYIKESYREDYLHYKEEYDGYKKWLSVWEKFLPSYTSQGDIMRCMQRIDTCKKYMKVYDTLMKYSEKVSLCNEYDIKPKISSIEIAYSNCDINNANSWIFCTDLVNNSSYDLAIIQMHQYTKKDIKEEINRQGKSADLELGGSYYASLASGHALTNLWYNENYKIRKEKWHIVPEDKHIFQVSDIVQNDEEIKLYMIGYNQGPILANTGTGIKPQITQGNISQNTDEVKMMYSIPTLQGSSGSPVINQYGELMAINFAGLSTTQSFNYGIKVNKLKELLQDGKVKHLMDDYLDDNHDTEDFVAEETVAVDVVDE